MHHRHLGKARYLFLQDSICISLKLPFLPVLFVLYYFVPITNWNDCFKMLWKISRTHLSMKNSTLITKRLLLFVRHKNYSIVYHFIFYIVL